MGGLPRPSVKVFTMYIVWVSFRTHYDHHVSLISLQVDITSYSLQGRKLLCWSSITLLNRQIDLLEMVSWFLLTAFFVHRAKRLSGFVGRTVIASNSFTIMDCLASILVKYRSACFCNGRITASVCFGPSELGLCFLPSPSWRFSCLSVISKIRLSLPSSPVVGTLERG